MLRFTSMILLQWYASCCNPIIPHLRIQKPAGVSGNFTTEVATPIKNYRITKSISKSFHGQTLKGRSRTGTISHRDGPYNN